MTSESPRWFKLPTAATTAASVSRSYGSVASRGLVPVRDSKDLAGPVLGFPAAAFASFVGAAKAREFRAV
ncbi:DUF397 domain-containing protein [Streptomyces albidoflavus]